MDTITKENIKYIDTIIVGAGISGISFANKLEQESKDYLVFDHKGIGGCIATSHYKDMWFEMGAHTIYNSYQSTLNYLEDQGIQNEIIKRKNHPFLFVKPNNKIQSIFTNINPISAGINMLKNFNKSKNGKTVSEYGSLLFGKANYNNTLRYCFDAVLSQDSRNFPMEYLFKKYPKNKSYPRSFTFKQGLSDLYKNFNTKNVVNEKVEHIRKDGNKWLVTTNMSQYICNNVCIATPWSIAKDLLSEIADKISTSIYQPKTSRLKSIAIVIPKNRIENLKEIAGLIGKEKFFYSAVSRDTVDHPTLRALVFHCKKEGFDKQKTIEKICSLLKINALDIEHIQIKDNELPCYDINHAKFVQTIDNQLDSLPGLYLSGNYFDRLAIENCVKRSHEELQRYKKSSKHHKNP